MQLINGQGAKQGAGARASKDLAPSTIPPSNCAAGALQSVSQQAMKLKFIDIVKIILTGIARGRRKRGEGGG